VALSVAKNRKQMAQKANNINVALAIKMKWRKAKSRES